MKPVDQTKFWEAPAWEGNCLQAATASLLELSLSEVPNFHDCQEGFWGGFRKFCEDRCLTIMQFKGDLLPEHPLGYWYFDCYYLAYGPAVRGCDHAVVYRRGKLAHDPHPRRAGLIKVETSMLLVPNKELPR